MPKKSKVIVTITDEDNNILERIEVSYPKDDKNCGSDEFQLAYDVRERIADWFEADYEVGVY